VAVDVPPHHVAGLTVQAHAERPAAPALGEHRILADVLPPVRLGPLLDVLRAPALHHPHRGDGEHHQADDEHD
jgi:hypothetical protein